MIEVIYFLLILSIILLIIILGMLISNLRNKIEDCPDCEYYKSRIDELESKLEDCPDCENCENCNREPLYNEGYD